MQRVQLEVQSRSYATKGETVNNNGLRAQGWVPAVVYGHGDPVSVMVEIRTLKKALHTAGANALYNVKLGGDTALSIIKEVQRDLLSHDPIHVDFLRINVKEKLEISVPIHTVGVADGVKNQGGILEHITREVRLRCLPDDIPASIDVDVSKLTIGQSISLSDIPAPKGVEYLTTGDHMICHVVAPKVEEVKPATPAEGAAAAGEPEVIAKGKKDEEGAAGAAGAAPAAAPAGKEKKK